jgi:hypothetical protein
LSRHRGFRGHQVSVDTVKFLVHQIEPAMHLNPDGAHFLANANQQGSQFTQGRQHVVFALRAKQL